MQWKITRMFRKRYLFELCIVKDTHNIMIVHGLEYDALFLFAIAICCRYHHRSHRRCHHCSSSELHCIVRVSVFVVVFTMIESNRMCVIFLLLEACCIRNVSIWQMKYRFVNKMGWFNSLDGVYSNVEILMTPNHRQNNNKSNIQFRWTFEPVGHISLLQKTNKTLKK